MPLETKSSSRLHALLCAFVLLACVLVTWPFVEMGVNDDWSFIRTAQLMAQTGHVMYNGWAAMILGWQILAGALFIKLFGFSFTIARLPTFFLALLTPCLLHRVLVRFGLHAWNATLLTLTIVLSPILLPLAATFMTDVSGFFCILLCLYSCQRALQADSGSASLAWLYCAALVNIVDGTVRQIVWLGVLVMVPCTAWLLRRRKQMLLHGAALWLAGFTSVLICLHWYVRQPYSANEKLIDGTLNADAFSSLGWNVVKAFVSLLFFTLPVLIVFPLRLLDLGRTKALKAYGIIALATLVILFLVYRQFKVVHTLTYFAVPWLLNIFTTHGIMQDGAVVGHQPIIIHLPLRSALSIITLISGMSCAAYVLLTHRGRKDISAASDARAGDLTWHQTTILLIPFSLAYFVLLMPRAAFHTLFDRYLVPLVLVLGVFALRFLQEHSRRTGWALSAVTLATFTLGTVAGTHDFYSLTRARLAAAEEVTRSGVPRTAVDAGLEYDGWTELLVAGYVNDPHITIPAGAYKPLPKETDLCNYSFLPYTPDVKPAYVLSFDPSSCFKPSHYAPVPYHMWIAPHQRTIYIQQVN